MVEEPSKDLGDIFENKGKVSTFFTLKNPYKEDTIRILNIVTSCGCTAVLTQDTLIPPQSTLDIEISYDPKGRLGLFVKSVEILSLTGNETRSRMFLKISGNVIAENRLVQETNVDLLEYKVAPIYFFPITPYDTSYLDFNYIISFVNDLSYEIDFYQFTTVGFEVSVNDKKHIPELEFLLNYSRKKILNEFALRGFYLNTIFFQEPVFKYEEIPTWATAKIRVFSANFDVYDEEVSVIKLSEDEVVENQNLMLNYERFSIPTIDEIIDTLNLEGLESKLFMNSELKLKGIILYPKNKNFAENRKFADKLEKRIFKELKKNSGVTKDFVSIKFDSLAVNLADKYHFMLWDESDEEEQQKFSYEIKRDIITPPLLPTYRQSTIVNESIDMANKDFRRFWRNIVLNQRAGHDIKLLIESSVSHLPRTGEESNMILAVKKAEKAKLFIENKFKKETGKDISIEIKSFVRGPKFEGDMKKYADFAQYEYLNIIPLVHNRANTNKLEPKPYMVNFDYFFNGVDTASWVFNKFANYVAAAVVEDGFVELRIESSISQVPIERKISNLFLAYRRANESELRIREFIKTKLIDPNRVIFTDERYLINGPIYDGKIPIIKYRKFQYVKILPEKFLTD